LAAGLVIVSATSRALETAALQGTWSGARFSEGTGTDASKGIKLELTIQNNHVKGRRLPEGDLGEGDITLSNGGKNIDAVGTSKSQKGRSYQGIIKVEGDTLFWCTATGGKQRPTEFVADGTKGTFLVVLKRQKS
jgi:uncharacterized protein (TIGR03067 family)